MVRNCVSFHMPKKLFDLMEEGRKIEQQKLRNNPKLGSNFNLSQLNFGKMLAARNFKFVIPPQKPLIDIVRRKTKRRGEKR